MKVIILAGGLGSRLGTITEDIPKPMVKVGDKPILWHIMNYYSYYGLKDFILSVGYKADIIKEYFLHYKAYNNDFTINLKSRDIDIHNDYHEIDWNVTLVNTGLYSLKGARIKRVENYLTDDINMMTYGDGMADIDITKLLNFHKKHKKILTITGVRPPARFGEIIEHNNEIVDFKEKQTSVGLINGGFMVFNKKFLDYLSVDEDCDFERGALEELAKKGEIMVYKHTGKWECVDTERDLTHLNRIYKDNKAFWVR